MQSDYSSSWDTIPLTYDYKKSQTCRENSDDAKKNDLSYTHSDPLHIPNKIKLTCKQLHHKQMCNSN